MGTTAGMGMKITRTAWGFPNRSFVFYLLFILSFSPPTMQQRERERARSRAQKMIATNVDIFSVYLFICIGERGGVVDFYGVLWDSVRACWVSTLFFILLSLSRFSSLPWPTTSGELFTMRAGGGIGGGGGARCGVLCIHGI